MHKKAKTIQTIVNYIVEFKCIYISGTKVVGSSKGSSGPSLMRVEKRMQKVRGGEDQGAR